ncbi:MAG: type IV pilus twitching motility protein PilT [Armatimonadota bacterium]
MATEHKEVSMNDLLKLTMQRNASDLHITMGLPPIIRVNGKLTPTEYPRLMPEDTKKLIYSILSDKQKEKFEKSLELDCSHGLKGYGRFRVNVFRQRGSVSAALRVISQEIPSREELGLPETVEEILHRPNGLVLVTGPTGMGKSTSIACMLDMINATTSQHIITVEDPIEYIHHHKKSMINQRELGQDTYAWSNALRSALREDPDVILVGEMRDLETISYTLTAAETGHLVFSTLHTCDAAQTIDRIIDVFPPHQQQQIRVQLAAVLVGVFSQQLIPHANGTGRILALEVLQASSAIKNLIREGKTYQIYNAIQTSSKDKMQTMEQALYGLYKKNLVTLEDALKATNHPAEFKHMLDKIN